MTNSVRRTEAALTRDIEHESVPWTYGDYETEYRALRTRAAAFDLRPMGRLLVTGDGALEALEAALARSIEYLLPERSIMSLVLDESGGPIDVVAVHLLPDGHLVECSPGRRARVVAALAAADEDLQIDDRTDSLACFGVEGPEAAVIVEQLLGAEVRAMPYQSLFVIEGSSWTVSRTGSTGEFGYKLLVPADDADALWTRIVDTCEPAGWEVLQSAMLEMRQPIPWIELTGERSVEAGRLNWLVDLDQGDFVGKAALEAMRVEPPAHEVIGFVGPAVTAPTRGTPVLIRTCEVGEVLATAANPVTGKLSGLAVVRAQVAAVGLDLTIDGHPFTTSSSPYVIPASWGVATGEWDEVDGEEGAA